MERDIIHMQIKLQYTQLKFKFKFKILPQRRQQMAAETQKNIWVEDQILRYIDVMKDAMTEQEERAWDEFLSIIWTKFHLIPKGKILNKIDVDNLINFTEWRKISKLGRHTNTLRFKAPITGLRLFDQWINPQEIPPHEDPAKTEEERNLVKVKLEEERNKKLEEERECCRQERIKQEEEEKRILASNRAYAIKNLTEPEKIIINLWLSENPTIDQQSSDFSQLMVWCYWRQIACSRTHGKLLLICKNELTKQGLNQKWRSILKREPTIPQSIGWPQLTKDEEINVRRYRAKLLAQELALKQAIAESGDSNVISLPDPVNRITIDFNSMQFKGITDDDQLRWMSKYPILNVKQELQKALEWVIRKDAQTIRDMTQFLDNWIDRAEKNRNKEEC